MQAISASGVVGMHYRLTGTRNSNEFYKNTPNGCLGRLLAGARGRREGGGREREREREREGGGGGGGEREGGENVHGHQENLSTYFIEAFCFARAGGCDSSPDEISNSSSSLYDCMVIPTEGQY
jgi:hypothetical protein